MKDEFEVIFKKWSKSEDDSLFEEMTNYFSLEEICYKYAKKEDEDLMQELLITIYESLYSYREEKYTYGIKSYINHKLRYTALNYCMENVYNPELSQNDTRKLTNVMRDLKTLSNIKKLSKQQEKEFKELEKESYFLKMSSNSEKYVYNKALENDLVFEHSPRIKKGFNAEERYIIDLLSEGYNQKEISEKIGVSYRTIKRRINKMKNQ